MEQSTQPFTQAIEQSSLPLLSTSDHPLPPIASTSTLAADSSQAAAPPVPSAPEASQAESQPAVVLSGFAAAQSLAAAKPNPVPYIEPPSYVAPALASTAATGPSTGVAALSHPKQFLTNEEREKMTPDQLRETSKSRGVPMAELLSEDEVQKYDTATLRKMGLGRTPSGALRSSRSPLKSH